MSQLNFGFSPNSLFPFENIKKLKKKIGNLEKTCRKGFQIQEKTKLEF
jgi:hypothetical protein